MNKIKNTIGILACVSLVICFVACGGNGNSSEDWDSILDKYEEYADKYIALEKKLSNGDTSVMTEYAEFMEKAQELNEKLEKAESEMTPSQMSRHQKITQKMVDAIQE